MADYNAGKNYGMHALTAGGVAPLEARQGDREATKGVVRNLLRGVNQMGDARFSSPEQAQFMRQWGYRNVHSALMKSGYNANEASALMAEAMGLTPEAAGYGSGSALPGAHGGAAKQYTGPGADAFRTQSSPPPTGAPGVQETQSPPAGTPGAPGAQSPQPPTTQPSGPLGPQSPATQADSGRPYSVSPVDLALFETFGPFGWVLMSPYLPSPPAGGGIGAVRDPSRPAAQVTSDVLGTAGGRVTPETPAWAFKQY